MSKIQQLQQQLMQKKALNFSLREKNLSFELFTTTHSSDDFYNIEFKINKITIK